MLIARAATVIDKVKPPGLVSPGSSSTPEAGLSVFPFITWLFCEIWASDSGFSRTEVVEVVEAVEAAVPLFCDGSALVDMKISERESQSEMNQRTSARVISERI